MRSQTATTSRRNVRYRPWVCTEHGALQAANLLRSDRAIAMSIYVIRAFIEQREKLAVNVAILKRLAEIDKTLLEHDTALRDIYQKLLPLLAPPPEPRRRQIGFHIASRVALAPVQQPRITRMTLIRETEGNKESEDLRFVRKKLCSLRYLLFEVVWLACYSDALARRRDATSFSAPPATTNSCAAGLSGGKANDFPSTLKTDLA